MCRISIASTGESMTKYNTNLASEFHVLSMLYRLGADAALSLGNKKAVDITVVNEGRTIVTIDVKGLEGRYDWPADNICLLGDPNHFYVLVSFEGRMADPLSPPSAWIIPANELTQFVRNYKTRTVISRSDVKAKGQRYLQAWSLIVR
jgi:hypothetical protein